MNLIKLLNITIRVTTLACRFLFVFFLAKFMSPAEVGVYGLMTATIAYALYFVGLDFYTFTTRELSKHDRSVWGSLLKNQIAVSCGLYCIVLPVLVFVFTNKLLPWHMAKWFFLLLVLEHICQELTRLFVAASEQIVSSVILFLRQGIWAVVVVILLLFKEDLRNLDTVFTAWILSCLFAIAFSLVKFKTMGIAGWGAKIDRRWIWRGIKVAVPFLVATLALRGVFTIDRYWVQLIGGLELVGAYVLFVGIANTLMVFLDSGVFSFAYPGMIAAYQKKDPEEFQRKMREMLILTLVFSALFVAVSSLLLPYLLEWLEKDVYLKNEIIFYWLLLVSVLSAVGMIPHYALYSQGRDKPIIHSHLAVLPIFILSVSTLSIWMPMLAVPIGLCISQLFILVWKIFAYYYYTPKPFLGIAKAQR